MRKLILALTLGAILIPNQGFTLGLGEIEVNSSLNQKLTARIDLLSAMPEDAESLIVKLASREEFIRAGLDRPLVLSSLKFKTSVEDGHVYINVLSPKPVREPFLNFLVEVDWPKGHLIREYTILLDPPVFMTKSQETAPVSVRPAMREAAGSVPVSVQSSVVEAPVAIESVVAEEVAVQEQESAQQQTSYTAPGYVASTDHRIQAGDTAWSLANSMRPDSSVSTEQMMMAMLRANPESFINENVNGLKRGYILRTPDAEDINAVSREEAKAAVSQQNALWREYQQSLASDRPASAIDENDGDTGYSSVAEVSDDSRLSIVSAGDGSSALGDMKDPSEMTASELREQLSLARERVEAERVEKENLQQQVGSLTTQVDKMKGLLTIEDDAMAEIQSVGDASKDDSGEEVLADDAVAELVDEEQALDGLADSTGDLGSEEGEAAEVAVTDTEDVFVDEAIEQAVETEAVIEDEVLDEWKPSDAQQQETDLIDTLLNNRMIVGGLLVLVLVVGAIVYLVMIKRRRGSASSESDSSSGIDIFDTKKEVALEDITDMIDDESIDDLVTDEAVEASMAAAEAEEEFDAEATMILPSETDTVVSQAEDLQSEEEPEEQDDVLAEADVYLAYGIYQQSEELLENAIKENPDKDSYRVKLAETYFAGKNSDGLKKLGVEMKARLDNEDSAAWKKVAALGKELCPDADVFQQSDLDTELDVNDLMPKSPEPMDIDLAEDTDETALDDLDFALDDLGGDESELSSMDAEETTIMSPVAESLDELEFDLSETDAVEEPSVEETSIEEEEFSLDIEASELDLEESSDAGLNMDFDMSLDSEAAPEESSEDDNALNFDLDMSMDDEAAPEVKDEPAIDFSMDEVASEPEDEAGTDFSMDESVSEAEEESALDLSMDDITSTEESSDVDVSLSMDDDLDDVDLSEPVDAEEIDTKLDLAKAYLDMGDHEGARDILDEVLAGGNAEQKKEAEELMAQAG